MSKNIVVLSDGTGKSGGGRKETNVHKLHRMVDKAPNQESFYDPGVGGRAPWWQFGIPIALGVVFGLGFSTNVQECYRFICRKYEPGDNIYLFGFSRGAATVRSLSALISLCGVLPPQRDDLIKEAYRIYGINDIQARCQRAHRFRKRHFPNGTSVSIKFLGVWDTVAMVGGPFKPLGDLLDKVSKFKHKFHNYKLSEAVEHARHALAIDEQRRTFRPLLWDSVAAQERIVKQVWFVGSHSDVGGGCKRKRVVGHCA